MFLIQPSHGPPTLAGWRPLWRNFTVKAIKSASSACQFRMPLIAKIQSRSRSSSWCPPPPPPPHITSRRGSSKRSSVHCTKPSPRWRESLSRNASRSCRATPDDGKSWSRKRKSLRPSRRRHLPLKKKRQARPSLLGIGRCKEESRRLFSISDTPKRHPSLWMSRLPHDLFGIILLVQFISPSSLLLFSSLLLMSIVHSSSSFRKGISTHLSSRLGHHDSFCEVRIGLPSSYPPLSSSSLVIFDRERAIINQSPDPRLRKACWCCCVVGWEWRVSRACQCAFSPKDA
jgi:hypothetical protein